jgi:trehalose synthase
MVAGDVGGIRSQIQDGIHGWLVSSVDEAASRCIEILDNPEQAYAMARAGKEHVREHFLMPRYLRDHLGLYASLLGT